MGIILKRARGCVFNVEADSSGWYKLDGLTGDQDYPILITGAQTADRDLVLPVTALGNLKLLYTLGSRFGDVQVRGAVLAGPAITNGSVVGDVIDWFDTSRVSKSGTTVNLSVPGNKGYKMYVTGLGLADPDAEFHVQPFIVYGLLASAAT